MIGFWFLMIVVVSESRMMMIVVIQPCVRFLFLGRIAHVREMHKRENYLLTDRQAARAPSIAPN